METKIVIDEIYREIVKDALESSNYSFGNVRDALNPKTVKNKTSFIEGLEKLPIVNDEGDVVPN